MRTVIIVVVRALALLAFTIGINSTKEAQKAKQDLNQERFTRMTAEESYTNANSKISSLQAELDRTKGKLNSTQKELEQLRDVNTDYRTRLDKAQEIKNNMEQKIQELQSMVSPAPAPVPMPAPAN